MPCNGVDAKLLQYEDNIGVVCDDRIDLPAAMSRLFGRPVPQNYVMINLEKDAPRYAHTCREFQKLSITNFVHLKGTWWEDTAQLAADLSAVTASLGGPARVTISPFAEASDPNVRIQGGPLACYCSHLRALTYGHQHFDGYTAVVEDDIRVANTDKIIAGLAQVPADWDIICLNASPLGRHYTGPVYKFTAGFHSTHFYIVRNACLPALLRRLYPVPDQVDVLISDQVGALNIYNIPDTVYQRNLSTNTQNNLHVILNSPNYQVVRDRLDAVHAHGLTWLDRALPDNPRNPTLLTTLVYDTLYDSLLHADQTGQEDYAYAGPRPPEYPALLDAVTFFVRCAKKGIDPGIAAASLLNVMLHTVHAFRLHNTTDEEFDEPLKAHGYGSTAHTYLLKNNNVVVKKYNRKLRWTAPGHDDSAAILATEVATLKRLPPPFPTIISHDETTIKMTYGGESLYDHFALPPDWAEQITALFDGLTAAGVQYPEFRLQNILVRDDRLTFVDFGLATAGTDNAANCARFVHHLGVLAARLTGGPTDRQLIYTYFKNLERRPAS